MTADRPPGVELLSAGSADEAFLRSLERRTRGEQLMRAGLPEPLVEMQADARWAAYAETWGTDDRWIALRDGTPIGTVWLGDAGDAVVVVDLVIAPEHQGHGLGTAILERVAREAAPRPVRLSVAENNPEARLLYRRLGYVEVGQAPGYVQLSRPGGAGNPA